MSSQLLGPSRKWGSRKRSRLLQGMARIMLNAHNYPIIFGPKRLTWPATQQIVYLLENWKTKPLWALAWKKIQRMNTKCSIFVANALYLIPKRTCKNLILDLMKAFFFVTPPQGKWSLQQNFAGTEEHVVSYNLTYCLTIVRLYRSVKWKRSPH